ncbi:MAG: hypothetical protein HY762_06940 [Planctomycetes bacterium]|nr:hypothetical protein [Planctomycetota bacterium]
MSNLWNYMGSRILTQAVAKGIVSEMEAEVVMEYAVYDRSWHYIAIESDIPPCVAIKLYDEAIIKLRRWIDTAVIILPKGRIVSD